MTNLETKRAALLKELAECEAEIEASRQEPVLALVEEYYYPEITPTGDGPLQELLCVSRDNVDCFSQIDANRKGIFIFKTRERCESFNKKLLELGEREAKILYGEVPHPDIFMIDLGILLAFTKDDGLNLCLNTNETLKTVDITKLRDFCNHALDYMEFLEVRKDG